jgi:hypothetical protein
MILIRQYSFLFLLSLITGIVVNSCSGNRHIPVAGNFSRISFLSEYDLCYNQNFRNTIIGGLSGIDYDRKKKIYYIISDDRSEKNPARFYEAQIIINQNKIDTVIFLDTKFLKTGPGNVYPDSHHDPYHTPDPEAIRYNPNNNRLLWSSEGERIVRQNKPVLEDPSITEINTDGSYIDTFILASQFHMHETESGPRQNSVFEGLAFDDNYQSLFVSVEEPLYDDGPRAALYDSTGIIRIIRYDVSSRNATAQYAYTIDAVSRPPKPPGSFKNNGVSEILSVGMNQLLVVERSFSTGWPGCTIKVFLADLSRADNIDNIPAVENKKVRMVSKKLLINMDSLGFYIDNIEGVTFGPDLPDGHKTLLFVSDNNFNPFQKTQFLLFEIE